MEGYNRGLDKIRIIMQANLEKKIPYLTLFTLSSENLFRTSINNIFEIILNCFEKFLHEIIDENKIKISGTKRIAIIKLYTRINNHIYINLQYNKNI